MFDRPILGRLYAEAGICDGLRRATTRWPRTCDGSPACPCIHQPGTAWEYGLNTDVLGRLVEVVSGQSLDAFLVRADLQAAQDERHAFRPARGRSATAWPRSTSPGRMARSSGPAMVRRSRGALIYSAELPPTGERRVITPAARACVSTADDYARFLQMLLNRGELDGVRVLRPETVDAMTRHQTGGLPLWIPVHGFPFGYGFGVTTRPDAEGKKDAVGSFSWGGIYYTDFWVNPKHELIGIMMTQILPSGQLKLRDEFHRLVNEAVRPSSAAHGIRRRRRLPIRSSLELLRPSARARSAGGGSRPSRPLPSRCSSSRIPLRGDAGGPPRRRRTVALPALSSAFSGSRSPRAGSRGVGGSPCRSASVLAAINWTFSRCARASMKRSIVIRPSS